MPQERVGLEAPRQVEVAGQDRHVLGVVALGAAVAGVPAAGILREVEVEKAIAALEGQAGQRLVHHRGLGAVGAGVEAVLEGQGHGRGAGRLGAAQVVVSVGKRRQVESQRGDRPVAHAQLIGEGGLGLEIVVGFEEVDSVEADDEVFVDPNRRAHGAGHGPPGGGARGRGPG